MCGSSGGCAPKAKSPARSAIESANKEVGSRLLVSDAVFQAVKDQITVGKNVRVTVKGKSGEHLLHEILSLVGAANKGLTNAPRSQ